MKICKFCNIEKNQEDFVIKKEKYLNYCKKCHTDRYYDKEKNRCKSREWSKKVKERDGNKCTQCFSIKNLHSHHIVSWKKDKNLRYDINNGITLCASCHGRLERSLDKDIHPFRKGNRPSPSTEIKKGQHLSPSTEFKKGESISPGTQFKKGISGSPSTQFKKGISASPQTQFEKGVSFSPKTQFKKGESASPETQFKKGMTPWNKGLKKNVVQ